MQFSDCLNAAGHFQGALDYSELHQKLAEPGLQDALGWVPWHTQLLTHLRRFERAIAFWDEHIAVHSDDPIAIGERALLYSRTGQYAKAEQDLATLRLVYRRSFPEFYHLYWRGNLDAAREYYDWLASRQNLPLIYKYWGAFLLGDADAGFDYLAQEVALGLDPIFLRINTFHVLPESVAREVEAHPRFQAILEHLGIDRTWQDELLEIANELTEVTGIHVRYDSEY